MATTNLGTSPSTRCLPRHIDHQQLLLKPGQHRLLLRRRHYKNRRGCIVLRVHAGRARLEGGCVMCRAVQHAAQGGVYVG